MQDLLRIYASCESVLYDNDDGYQTVITKVDDVYEIKQRPFNEMKELNLYNCQITSIDEKCFSKMGYLETLYLKDNKLVNLKADTFQQLKSLKHLNLYNCEISAIPNDFYRIGSSRRIIFEL